MSDAAPGGAFPPINFPTVYVDGIQSVNVAGQVIKLYMFRNDPSLLGTDGTRPQPFLQLVIPIENFVPTVVFLSSALDDLVARGVVKQEQIDDLRQTLKAARAGAENAPGD